ncbi:MAG: LacI family transcriptional regulator [Propionibacteriaceae bacterium]|jgi:DNA-binding LacI/PurR family transcriptional regulator|nr:LacI family transcriptional regulator [Propionibacteriaceae bacterium]
MSVTMKEVAERAEVSISTVSNVLNGYAHIRPKTRARVEAAIEELGYRVNMPARQLRIGRTGVIGLALPELSLAYWGEFADSVMRAAQSREIGVLIEVTDACRKRVLEVLDSPYRRITDGLLVVPNGLEPHETDLLDVPYPLVVLGERIFGAPADHVTMANTEGARAAVAHLASRGCRRIATLGAREGEVMGSATLRLRGYHEALADAGLPEDPDLVVTANPWTRATGAAAVRELLARGIDVDAIFAMNDAMALGALHELHRQGVEVPNEVAVIGFDDIGDAEYYEPALSSIAPGRDEIAERAVDMLLARIAGETAEPRLVLADYQVMERQSTAVRR